MPFAARICARRGEVVVGRLPASPRRTARARRLTAACQPVTSPGGRAAWPASRRPRRSCGRPVGGARQPEPTSTVICSRAGPLTGDRNSSAGRGVAGVDVGLQSLTAGSTSSGSVAPLSRYGPVGGDLWSIALGALGRGDEGEELLAASRCSRGLGDVRRRRASHNVAPFVAGVVARAGRRSRCPGGCLGSRRDRRRDRERQHRILRDLAVGQHA